MSVFAAYKDYFKYQCENHASLTHGDWVGERVFEVISVEEALGDFRTSGKEKDFVFRLIEPTYVISDDGQAPIRKQVQGGFVVAKFHSPRSGVASDYYTAMDDAEIIVDDFIAKMIADSKNGHPLFFNSLDSRQQITVTPTLKRADCSYSGWICTFNFSQAFSDCASESWEDEGLTPFE